ncbi:gamma carbonic anhydrase family protein [Magnetospirillum molischianum]|uniref:Protein yrdA n=1 Tax=Magnetospirillum molischianum DSM 120 TaxID=1150626 RepID=H8FRG2_MAGML|nr:gamma carbonic anhydrase family protein [Magnetospirillum molischianum]CCG40950.1 Protein yrdA [Magnetospirillum molischianum DSM 120]
MSGLILPWQGRLPEIDATAFIAPNATVIGDVTIGAESSIWFGCILRGDVNEIRIGARTNIQDGTVIHVTRRTFGTNIGSDITIGHAAVLHGCTLEDCCFIGMGAVLLDGVVVEREAMIAAGAVVTPGKRIRTGELWGGNPARLLRPLTEQDRAHFPISAANYTELSRHYRDNLG